MSGKYGTDTVILDVDGVLLNWDMTVKRWLIETGKVTYGDFAQRVPTKSYTTAFTDTEWGQLLGDRKEDLLTAFATSLYVGDMAPIDGAVDGVMRLRRSGYRLFICTAFGKNRLAIKARIANLERIFGVDTFDGFMFAELHNGNKAKEINDFFGYRVPPFVFIDDSQRKIMNVARLESCRMAFLFDPPLKSKLRDEFIDFSRRPEFKMKIMSAHSWDDVSGRYLF